MKLTKGLLERLIKEEIEEARYRGKYYRRRNPNPMNQQSDWYADKKYKPPAAPTYDSWVKKEEPIAGAFFNWRSMPLLVAKCIEMAPTVKSEAEVQPAVELIATEIAMEISTAGYQVNKDAFLRTKGRHIKRMLEAAIKDHKGIPVEQYKSK